MLLPNAIVIGPKKAGTTWIHEYLHARGDVGLPAGVKETFFFDRRYDRGVAWYSKHFRCADRSNQRIVEVAPSYFHHADTPARIRTVLGRVPLVCTLRDPVRRAYSLYLHLHRFGVARGTFREAVHDLPEILESSRYAYHLRRWTDCFGADSVRVLLLESLKSDPQRYAQALCTHLAIPYRDVSDRLRSPVNAAAVPTNTTIARMAKWTSDTIRSFGLYRVVNVAKAVGMKEVLFGRPGAKKMPELSYEDARWFGDLVAPEIESLGREFGVNTDLWNRIQVCPETLAEASWHGSSRGSQDSA